MQPQWKPEVLRLVTDADGSDLAVDTDAYTAGDVVGGLLRVDVDQIAGGCYVAWARLVDDGDQAKGYKLHCFYEQPSTIADDAAFAPTEADKLKRFTVIELSSSNVNQDGADSDVFGAGDKYTGKYHICPVLDDGRMYFYLEDADASNPTAADDITVDVCVMRM